MYIDKYELLNSLTKEDIIKILRSLGSDYTTDENANLIFKTVCHHKDAEDGDFALYYYEKKKSGEPSKKFYCSTDCKDEKGFDIFTLIQKAYMKRGEKLSFHNSMKYVLDVTSRKDENYYLSHDEAEKLQERNKVSNERKAELIGIPTEPNKQKAFNVIDPKVLEIFSKLHYKKWLQENISHNTLDRFNIRFDIYSNKIIIPHYDVSGNLVGIKGISLNEEEEKDKVGNDFISIEGKSYYYKQEHNLYGLNFNKQSIIERKEAMIFEDEKDVLLIDGGIEKNVALSIGGTTISDEQFEILRSLGVKKITIAYKKRYKCDQEIDGFIETQKGLLEKYKGIFQFSLIVDVFDSIKYGASMLSEGNGIFNVLKFLQIEI